MILPIVHMNGTSRDSLIEMRLAVRSALRNVEAALREMSPHGRDYYPEPGRMEKAIEQHRRRQQIVADLGDEIDAELIAIQDL